MSSFYVTTPLYYINDKPHLGTAYCTIVVDTMARFHRLFGDDVMFLTGTDEHGQKLANAAQKAAKDPQEFCNEMAQRFKSTWEEFNIDYQIFFRTTDDFHKKAVQKALNQIHEQGDIYAADYEGWYCVSEEVYYTDKDIVDGKTPSGKEVTRIKEKNYFFKMSKYVDQLKKHIQENPNFIRPESRRNEVLGFLNKEVHDLSISRPKSRLKWGIEIPFDTDYVTYVWFDALLNYATGVGFLQDERKDDFNRWWVDSGANHVLGKDILTTHAVYWTTMLLALGAPLPRCEFATGWILNQDSEKMSKSQGDVVDPLELKDVVGVDGLRYFLVREIHLGNDAPFSKELLFTKLNTDLSNNLGNLVNRTTNLFVKYFEGKVPAKWHDDEATQNLIATAETTAKKVQQEIEDWRPSYALDNVIQMLNEANKYLEDKAPWKEAKTDVESAGKSLYAALECVRIAGILLLPVMPTRAATVLERIGCSVKDHLNEKGSLKNGELFEQAQKFGLTTDGTVVTKGEPIFPRLDI